MARGFVHRVDSWPDRVQRPPGRLLELSLQWCPVDRDADAAQWKWIRIAVPLNTVNKEIRSATHVHSLFIRTVECS